MGEFFNEYLLDPLAFWTDVRGDFWLGYVIAALVQCVILLQVVAVGALFFIWLERKVSGRIQDRLGPTRVGGRFGWLQTLADGVKLLAKEDLTPDGADPMLFRMAPYVSFAAGFSAYLALPFSNTWVAWELNIALFFILAVLGIEVFGVILAGYASGSKWSLFGAMREAAQVVSYEVPLGLCAVIPVVILGTMNLMTIGNMQAGLFTNWLVLHDPFTFAVFFIYFTCATASVNRAPFDLAEAESELVAGFHTEYSGLRWSFFFMAEYGSMFAVAGLAAILFFGGWNGPIPIFYWLGWASLDPSLIEFGTAAWFKFQFANLFGALNFILKAVIGVTVMMWIRWTLPRLRIDQVMTTCLKYCTPLAAACFLGVVLWQMYVPFSLNDHYGGGWLQPFEHRSEVRERWVLASERQTLEREAIVSPSDQASHENTPVEHASVEENQIAGGKPASGRLEQLERLERPEPPAPVRRRLSGRLELNAGGAE